MAGGRRSDSLSAMSRVNPAWAPASTLPEERRGDAVGRFCRGCASFYPLHAGRHKGKPSFGRDLVSAPCTYEGQPFAEGAIWWESAVALLPAASAGPASEPLAVPA